MIPRTTTVTLIVGIVSAIVLMVYVLPIENLLSPVDAAPGGNGDNNSDKNDNPQRFKVCEHNQQPQKCYGHTTP